MSAALTAHAGLVVALPALPNPCNLPGAGAICDVPGKIASAGWDATVTSLVAGLGMIVKLLFTFWMSFPDPDVTAGNSQIAFLDTHLVWVVNAVAAGTTLIAAMAVILTRNTAHARTLGAVLLRVVAAGVFVGPLVSGLLTAGDAYGHWIINDAVGAQFGAKLLQLGTPVSMTPTAAGSTLMLLFALAGSLGSLMMIATLIFRTVVVTVLVGLLPLTAAASMSASGRQAWAKHTAWLLAFVLVKPAGATLLAVAFHWVQDGKTVQDGLLGGICLLMMGLLLPVMLRLLVPATSTVAGRSGALAGAGAVATGALAFIPGGQAPAAGARAAAGGRLLGRAGANTAAAGRAGTGAGAVASGGGTTRSAETVSHTATATHTRTGTGVGRGAATGGSAAGGPRSSGPGTSGPGGSPGPAGPSGAAGAPGAGGGRRTGGVDRARRAADAAGRTDRALGEAVEGTDEGGQR